MMSGESSKATFGKGGPSDKESRLTGIYVWLLCSPVMEGVLIQGIMVHGMKQECGKWIDDDDDDDERRSYVGRPHHDESS
ncbi:hypothetical protein OIU76_023411 [Salix suchowensis]|nr:hypothetical protein OIU76_023411 [Salix suchowensis]